jgi:hypothetical protein
MKGVMFGTIHSYNDLGLVLRHIEIEIPKAKVSSVEIESSDGVVDTTNALSDIVFFNNRTLTFEFSSFYDDKWFIEQMPSIINQLQGRKLHITLDNDDTWYYVGRLDIEVESDKVVNDIVVTCDCEPYKYSISETVRTFEVTEETEYTIDYIGTKALVPTWTCSIVDGADLSLILNGAYYPLKNGDNIVADFIIKNGVTKFKLAGNGTAQIRYREAML